MAIHDLLYTSARLTCWSLATAFFRTRAWGAENVPAKGGLILAANHQSYADPFLVGGFTTRELNFMARDTLFNNMLAGPFIRYFNAFPVKRGKSDVTSFKHALRLLKDGQALLLFPEGTRTETGRVGPLQPGVIGMATRTQAKIMPVAIEGAFEAWPRDARIPRPAKVCVEFGRPMDPAAFESLSAAEAAGLLTCALRELHNSLRVRAGRRPFVYAADDDVVIGDDHLRPDQAAGD